MHSTCTTLSIIQECIDRKVIDTDKLHNILDKEINLEELDSAMKQLKLGKAVAEDTVANEFLKYTRPVF